jgi:WD40 repeat protein
MASPTPCPKCTSIETRYRPKRGDWTCDDCDHRWVTAGAPERPKLRIFLSYGHDEHVATALRIKADLIKRGHEVWFDAERLQEGRDWEQYIEEGLSTCDKVVLLMTPYSVRRRNSRDPNSRDGYCLNEIAKAMEKNKLIVPVLLVTLDDGPPASICRIQYLDLRDTVPVDEHEDRYQIRLERLAKAVEEDDLDFEGGQARLARLLRPLSFEGEMSRHIASFTGRQWLFAELDRWLQTQSSSRVFWLVGGPGIGKTAVAAHLCHYRPEVIGYHFCTHGHTDKSDPARAVLSMAYQMAQHLPEYAKRLSEKELEKDVAKNAGTLFDTLVVEPLSRDFPAPDGSLLVIIDAMDEATSGGRNAIAELVRDHWAKTPAWLRLVITSRPELEVVSTLGHLDPFALNAQRAENLEDLERFLERELLARKVAVTPSLLRTILEKSEGVFLYARVLFDEIDAQRLTLEHPEELPVGLYGHYHRFFTRQLPDVDRYRSELRPLLEIVCAGQAPVPVALLARALGISGFDLRERLVRLGSLLTLRRSADGDAGDGDAVALFHKSVRDWLTALDEKTSLPVSGSYVIDGHRGARQLADAVVNELKGDLSQSSAYALRYAPSHLVAADRATDAAELMAEFGYHYTRLERLGREDVVNVTRDFIAIARSKLLTIPLRQRLETWQVFYAENAHLLRREVPQLAPATHLLQLAVAHAETSPVSLSAEGWLEIAGPGVRWLRSLRRPREVERRACLRTFEGHEDRVFAIALHPDSRRCVSTSEDKTLKIWDLETGECLDTLAGHEDWVTAVALHPDGIRAMSGCRDGTLKLWNLDTRECLRTIQGHSEAVIVASFLPGKHNLASGSSDKTIKIWDIKSGVCLRTINLGTTDGHAERTAGGITTHNNVTAIAVHPDGNRAVSASDDKTLKVWDIETGKCLRTLDGHKNAVHAVAFYPDGRRVVSGSWDRTLKVWDPDTGVCVRTLVGHNTNFVEVIAVDANGWRAVSGTPYNQIMIWELRSGECLGTLQGHGGPLKALAIHPDGRCAISGSSDKTLKLWNLDTDESRPLQKEPKGPLALDSTCRRAVSGNRDGTLEVWELDSGKNLCTLEALHALGGACSLGPIHGVAMAARGQQAAAWAEPSQNLGIDSFDVWDLESEGLLRRLPAQLHLQCVALTADGRRALSGCWRELKLWDVATGECLQTFGNNRGNVGIIAFCQDHGRALSAHSWNNRRVVHLWDLGSGDCLRTLEWDDADIRVLALSPSGHCSITRGDDVIQIWEITTGQCLHTVREVSAKVSSSSLSLDGSLALTTSAGTLSVWDLESETVLARWESTNKLVGHGTANGRVIATDENRGLLVLQLMPPGHVGPNPTTASWHAEWPLLAVALANGVIAVSKWHSAAEHLEEIAHTEPTGAVATNLRFSIDGTALLVRSADGTERVLDAATLAPATAPACGWAEPRVTSSDGRWRVDLESGQVKVEAVV